MKIRVIGIPSNVGAMNKGPELGPKYFRKAGLIERLRDKNDVIDLGDIEIDNDHFRHDYGAVRNWPAPLIMWEKIINTEEVFVPKQMTIAIGGGCSIVTGLFRNFYNIYGADARLLTIDHHIDIRRPSPDQCMGATAYTLHFLTQENQWISPLKGFSNKNITAMGFDPDSLDPFYTYEDIQTYPAMILQEDPEKIATAYLESLPLDSKVLVHLDLDVIGSLDFKSVYMPDSNGVGVKTIKKLLSGICNDPRIAGIVITEFSPTDAAEKEVDAFVKLLEDVFSLST